MRNDGGKNDEKSQYRAVALKISEKNPSFISLFAYSI